MRPEPAVAVSLSLPEPVPESSIYSIKITDQQKLWFLLKNISVFDCIEWFNSQSIVKTAELNAESADLRKITFETDLGWSFDSFIEAGKFIISERSVSRPGTTKYLTDAGASVGDILHIRKVNDFTFTLSLERKNG
jgi:hypothetical protein